MDEHEITRLPRQKCPACGHTLDATMEASEGRGVPEPGNYMICFGCSGLLIFDEGLRFRPLTVEESKALAEDPEALAEVNRAIAEVTRIRSRRN